MLKRHTAGGEVALRVRRDMMMFAIALYQRGQAGVGTRPVDEIRITPGIEMAVYERG